MCKTRIKIIDEYITGEDADKLVNSFISNPENKVAKVNSIETEVCYIEELKKRPKLKGINFDECLEEVLEDED